MSGSLEDQLAEARIRNRRRLNPEFVGPEYLSKRQPARLKQYGLTTQDYVALLTAHKDRCAICGAAAEKRELCIDHCHASGKVRGLLCSRCNAGLGSFRDTPALLRKAIRYLMRARS